MSTKPTLLAQQAQTAYQAGQYTQAADLFEQAAAETGTAGDESAAAELANNASVAALQAGDAARALRHAANTDELFARAGDRHRQALALGNQAAAHEALGHLDQAANLYQRCSDLLKQTGTAPEMRSAVLKSLSALQLRSGNQLQAMATMQAALDMQKKLTLRERILNKLLKVPFRMMK
jgi:tetratricopeptide (TPR) repeat protein